MAEGEYIPPLLEEGPPGMGNHQMDEVWKAIRAERTGTTSPAPLRETVIVKRVEDPALPEAQVPLF